MKQTESAERSVPKLSPFFPSQGTSVLRPNRPRSAPIRFPIVGHIPSVLRKGLLNVIIDVCGDTGQVGQLVMGPRTVHIVSHPEHLRYLFTENGPNYIKGSALNNLRLLLGEGLVTSDGDIWKTNRNLVQAAFQREKIAALIRLAAGPIQQMLAEWDRGPETTLLDMDHEIRRLVFIISGLTLFGCNLTKNVDEATKAFATALRAITDRNQNVYALPLSVPTPGNLRLKTAVRTLDRHVREIIEQGRGIAAGNDVLSVLLGAWGTNDRRLRDEVITLYLAGHDATSHTLTWVLYFLACYPDVQQRVRHEVYSALGGRTPVYEDLRALPFTHMAIQESMRMRSPAALIVREAVADDEIGGRRIPAGSWVLISSYLTHRMAEFWPQPDQFMPERFSTEALKGRHPFAYYPFGVGPRTCIGNHLATLEVQLIIAMLLQRYEFKAVPGEKVVEVWHGTLHPRGGLRLIRSRI